MLRKIQNILRVYLHIAKAHVIFFNDALLKCNSREKIIFIDLGANVGQAHKIYSKSYNIRNTCYHLFEPNPFCFEILSNSFGKENKKVKILQFAAGVNNGDAFLYGLGKYEGGKLSQGASLLQTHNSKWYSSQLEEAVAVKEISFSEYLAKCYEGCDKLIIKMDVEGYELEILEDIINKKLHHLISILYVEFHAFHLTEITSKSSLDRRDRIVDQLEYAGVIVREWL